MPAHPAPDNEDANPVYILRDAEKSIGPPAYNQPSGADSSLISESHHPPSINDLSSLSDQNSSYSHFDPNLDDDEGMLGKSFHSSVHEQVAHLSLEEDSPYPEVRSAVSNVDDPDMPASTIRAWVLGLIWATILPGLNQFFFFRYPSVTIGGVRPTQTSVSYFSFFQLVAQLVVYPMGRAWARFMPNFTIFGHQVNPGPFTIKEHVRPVVFFNRCGLNP